MLEYGIDCLLQISCYTAIRRIKPTSNPEKMRIINPRRKSSVCENTPLSESEGGCVFNILTFLLASLQSQTMQLLPIAFIKHVFNFSTKGHRCYAYVLSPSLNSSLSSGVACSSPFSAQRLFEAVSCRHIFYVQIIAIQ